MRHGSSWPRAATITAAAAAARGGQVEQLSTGLKVTSNVWEQEVLLAVRGLHAPATGGARGAREAQEG